MFVPRGDLSAALCGGGQNFCHLLNQRRPEPMRRGVDFGKVVGAIVFRVEQYAYIGRLLHQVLQNQRSPVIRY